MNRTSRRSRRGPRAPDSGASAAVRAHLHVPLRHPGFLVAALVTAAAVLVSVTFRIFDFDLWQHLTVGRWMWAEHRIPMTQVWTWPTWGQPVLGQSWGFRILLWPFWNWGGVPGLYAWRWLVALVTFAVVFATARRMGAGPFVTLAVIALAVLAYRARSMVRPESLALVLFAAQVHLLEARRQGGPLRAPWLVAIAWLWINVHISFVLGFLVHVFYLADAAWRARRPSAVPVGTVPGTVGPAVALLLAVAISFVNPFGWEAVVKPFQFLLAGRNEPINQTIPELAGIDWATNWRNGLPLLVAGWPLLLAWRWRRRGPDVAELLACVFFTVQLITVQRFKSTYAVAAVPFVARNLCEWLGSLRTRLHGMPVARRGAITSAAVALLGLGEWTRADLPLGIGLDLDYLPVSACDFIETAGIRGRAFNHFWYGGYMEWRFWPQRDRLPFIDGHLEAGTERDRSMYAYAQTDADAWHDLEREKRFDFVLLSVKSPSGIALRDFIESEGPWATVFIDDAAAVFVRRDGPLAGAAARWGYRHLRVGPAGLEGLLARCAGDASLRDSVRVECERQIAGSPRHAVACALLAQLAEMDGRRDEARAQLRRALAADPSFVAARRRLAELGDGP